MNVTWCPGCGARQPAVGESVKCTSCGHLFAAPPKRATRVNDASGLVKFIAGEVSDLGTSVDEVKAWRPVVKPLTDTQKAALAKLAADPSAFVESGTLGLLRRNGLVGKVVSRDSRGSQRTTSPLTEAGRAYLEQVKP